MTLTGDYMGVLTLSSTHLTYFGQRLNSKSPLPEESPDVKGDSDPQLNQLVRVRVTLQGQNHNPKKTY